MSEITLKPAERRALRARAHPLHPVVSIGHQGLTPQVLHEIDIALSAHELVKVRVFNDDRTEREAIFANICAQMACAPVQHLGKLLILWRPQPEPEKKAKRMPKAAKQDSGEPGARAPGGTTRRKPAGGGAVSEPRAKGIRQPRRARGQPPDALDERGPARRPRSTKPARETPPSPKSVRGKGKRTTHAGPVGGAGFGSAARRPSPDASPAANRRTAGGPTGLPRAPNPRRRRTQSR